MAKANYNSNQNQQNKAKCWQDSDSPNLKRERCANSVDAVAVRVHTRDTLRVEFGARRGDTNAVGWEATHTLGGRSCRILSVKRKSGNAVYAHYVGRVSVVKIPSKYRCRATWAGRTRTNAGPTCGTATCVAFAGWRAGLRIQSLVFIRMSQVPGAANVVSFCVIGRIGRNAIVLALPVTQTQLAIWNYAKTVIAVASCAWNTVTTRATSRETAGAPRIVLTYMRLTCYVITTVSWHALIRIGTCGSYLCKAKSVRT